MVDSRSRTPGPRSAPRGADEPDGRWPGIGQLARGVEQRVDERVLEWQSEAFRAERDLEVERCRDRGEELAIRPGEDRPRRLVGRPPCEDRANRAFEGRLARCKDEAGPQLEDAP